jgi:hypothetical protein
MGTMLQVEPSGLMVESFQEQQVTGTREDE